MIALSNIAQGSAVLAVWWLTRKDEEQTKLQCRLLFHVT